jgi:hypothetical protein
MKNMLALCAVIGATLCVAVNAQQSTNTVDTAAVQDAIVVQNARIAQVDAQLASAQSIKEARIANENAQFAVAQAQLTAQKNKISRDKAKLQAALTNAPAQ